MYVLYYTIISIGIVTLLWYCFLVFKNMKQDLLQIKLIKEGKQFADIDICRGGIETLILRLTANQQVFAGICLTNIVSIAIMFVALYVWVYFIFTLVVFTIFTACKGVIFNLKELDSYREAVLEFSLDGYFASLSVKNRLEAGATIYSIVVLLILCLI